MTVTHADLPAPEALVPHKPPMLLLDEVLSFDEVSITTRSHITEANPFYVPGRGVPSYVTFEIMAQSISAHDGATRWQTGEPPAIGLLLGCRKFTVTRDWLQPGETVDTQASPLLFEGEMRSFECVVRSTSSEELATGAINVFRPEDPDAFAAHLADPHAS